MKSNLFPLFISITLIFSFYYLIPNHGFISEIVTDSDINFDIDNVYSVAQSPVDKIVQIEAYSVSSQPNIVVSSKYQVIGLNTFDSNVYWNLSLGENSPVIISDMKAEPLEEGNYPSNFYLTLSNGTIIKFDKEGNILWSQVINNGYSCSTTNCSRSISFLFNKTGMISNYDIILGGSDANLYFLLQNGSVSNNFQVNSSITVIKTFYPYTVIGSSLGKMYVYNYTDDLLWSKNLSSIHPIISIGIIENSILAAAWSENPITLNLSTGIELPSLISIETEIITFDSILVQEKVQKLYVSLLFGRLGIYDFMGTPERMINLDSNLLTDVEIGNVTASTNYEIIISTDVGSLAIINSSSGLILDELTVYNEMITQLTIADLDSDGIDDIIIGSVLGNLAVIKGEDFIPPRFLSGLVYKLTDDNILDIYGLTNELASSILEIKSEEDILTILENKTLRLNQSFSGIELDEDIVYTITLTIYDANSNSAVSNEISIRSNIIPKIPWDLYFVVLLGAIVGLTAMYFIVNFILRIRYNRLANIALGLGDYAKAIKLFYKGKNQDKIIETVKIIMNNPELASKMNEIAQAAELEDYISEIHDLIAHEG